MVDHRSLGKKSPIDLINYFFASQARQAEVKRLFRPIEELKKDFAELNVVIETDMQIMVRLINKFNSSSSSLEEKIAALFDLEYYVHQVLYFIVHKSDF